MTDKQKSSDNALVGILVNILIPVLILDYCSAGPVNPLERSAQTSFWHIGPLWALIIALLLPLCYGARTLIRTKKFDLIAGIGLIGVLLTGVISLCVIGKNGHIHHASPWLFAGKEALLPLILAGVAIVMNRRATPLLNVFIYTPALFDVPRIESIVARRECQEAYRKLLGGASRVLVWVLIGSSIANFCLSYVFMSRVLQQAPVQQQVAYNEAISDITWWGFLIIGVPILVATVLIMLHLIKCLSRLTGLSKDELLLR